MEPRFPNIEVQLSGEDGNAFYIIGRVAKAIRRVDPEAAEEFVKEATSGDYDNVLAACFKYVEVFVITKTEVDRKGNPVRTYHRTGVIDGRRDERYIWTHDAATPCDPNPDHCVVGREEKK